VRNGDSAHSGGATFVALLSEMPAAVRGSVETAPRGVAS